MLFQCLLVSFEGVTKAHIHLLSLLEVHLRLGLIRALESTRLLQVLLTPLFSLVAFFIECAQNVSLYLLIKLKLQPAVILEVSDCIR